MRDIGWFIVLSLAVWRISSLLAREDGPYGILAKFRHMIGVRYNDKSKPYGLNVVAELFTCVWCLSVWVGLALAWASGYSVNIHTYLIVALGLSSVAIIIDGVVK